MTEGFKKELDVNGVGYRVQMQGKNLVMNLGYSHQVIVPSIDGITIECPTPNKIVISGADKQAVASLPRKCARSVRLSRIRARASATPASLSVIRKARPVRALRSKEA